MAHPIFFSTAGTRDLKIVEAAKSLLPDSMVYMYTRTGEEGASFRREIEEEIQNCLLFVVFWSQDYLDSEHACRELALFRKMDTANASGRELLVIPTQRRHPNLQIKWKNPISGLDEHALGIWRTMRAIDPGADSHKIADQIERRIHQYKRTADILVLRPKIQSSIKVAIDAPHYRAKQFIFITGYEGDGRKTAISLFMDSTARHLTRRTISFDSVDNAEDLLLRLLDVCGIALSEASNIMQNVMDGVALPEKEIRRLIYQMIDSKNYFLISMDRFSGVDSLVGIPQWVSRVFAGFADGIAPAVFFVTSAPVPDSALRAFPNASLVRIPGLDVKEMKELVYRLSTLDPNSARWDDEKRGVVERISGSSPALCQIVMRKAAIESSLEFLESMANQEEQRFAANMSTLLAHIVAQYKNNEVNLLAIKIIEKLGVVSKSALDEILPRDLHKSYDLHGMLQQGVVERLSDDLLRIPPLLQRRLGFILLHTESTANALIAAFGSANTVVHDNYGPIYFANKAAAAVRGGIPPADSLLPFITLSMLFKIGLDRYSEQDNETACSILSRAMDRLEAQTSVEPATAVEIARYFGLAAARIKDSSSVTRACHFLESSPLLGRREQQGRAMAEFLRGFELRLENNHRESLAHFEQAELFLNGLHDVERQRGAILTEMSRALLFQQHPKFNDAVNAATKAYKEKDAAHNLNWLIKARILRFASGEYKSESGADAEIAAIKTLIEELSQICSKIHREFDLMRRAELTTVLALAEASSTGHPLDLRAAIDFAERALRMRAQINTQSFLWKLKIFDKTVDRSRELISETETILASDGQPARRIADATKINILAVGRNDQKRGLVLLGNTTGLGFKAFNFIDSYLRGKTKLSMGLMFNINEL